MTCTHPAFRRGTIYDYCPDCGAVRNWTKLDEWHSCDLCRLPGAVREAAPEYAPELRIYRVIRFSYSGRNKTILQNMTRSEAQEYCSRPDTSSHTTGRGSWFCGFDTMRGVK